MFQRTSKGKIYTESLSVKRLESNSFSLKLCTNYLVRIGNLSYSTINITILLLLLPRTVNNLRMTLNCHNVRSSRRIPGRLFDCVIFSGVDRILIESLRPIV